MTHKITFMLALAFVLAGNTLAASDPLADGFVTPPEQTRPWCYWYWISDNISKEGITRDLEAMARVGIGEALIGNIFLDSIPAGKIKVLSPEWWDLVAHAIREGGRTGVNIGMFNCPGWSQSGGPWIKPGQAMRYVAISETRVSGPKKFEARLPVPHEPFQDIAVLAFPAPRLDADALAARSPRVRCIPAAAGCEKLVDGDPATILPFPAGAGIKTPFTVEIEPREPLTVRTVQVIPSEEAFGADCELQAAGADGRFATVRRFKCDRSNMAPGVGFMPRGPVTIVVPATTAKLFRLVFTNTRSKKAELAEINLSGAARLEAFIEKQLGKMHPVPLPMWDTYMWPTPAEPDAAQLAVPRDGVRDLSASLAADGTLRWDVPSGDWVILRTGMTPTGMKNSPASPEGQGLEVDKMNAKLAQVHFNAFIGEVLRRVPAAERTAFRQVIADSYEMGSQNWTDGFDAQFKERYGYDPKPWLPVLTGRLVGSADQSERFLWDLRRLVADRVATDYVGGLREASKAHGLGLWLENYGHWGFPSEFLKYGSESDRIGGEFWVTGDLGSIECRAASSCANTYGKRFVSAESFTGGPPFQNAPGALKARGDWSFCEGVNHAVLHVNIQQPTEEWMPGINAPWGTEFNRHNTWFERGGKAWIAYERRCCWLLQQGWRVADAAYFIGEDAPKMTGARNPELPPGYDFDYINAEVIEKSLGVKNGVLALPHGTTYRVLVLPEQKTMRPEVLRKIRDLIQAGAVVIGPRPERSPSMQNYPGCDEEVRALAQEIWGADAVASGERALGKGRIIWGKNLADIFAALAVKPDFESSVKLRYTHRRDGDTEIYFVANPKPEPVVTAAAFRAGDRAPELWWPDSARIEQPAVYDAAGGVVRMPLQLGPQGSVFVVFRRPAAPPAQRLVSVGRAGRELLSTKVTPPTIATAVDSTNNFTIVCWVKPEDQTALMREANTGAQALRAKQNTLIVPPHGNTFGGDDHAGCGLAVGTNGVCVLEHGANYYSPTLVFKSPFSGWTHIAVVYRDGQPTLYLNGKLAHAGLKSKHIVHSGVITDATAGFRGQADAIQQFPKAWTEAEIARLMNSTPRPIDRQTDSPRLILNGRGEVEMQVAQAGDYTLRYAEGVTRSLNVPSIPVPTEIAGPWEVSFTPGWGAPEKAQFEKLMSWTQRPEEGIRFYSGAAVYRKTFELPASALRAPHSALYLDLGVVRDVATVRLNGRDLGTLWLAPWRVDVTDALKPGVNKLEIEVINPWNNRLVGDAALPQAQRHTRLLLQTVGKNAPLLPAGLLGPVTIQCTTTVKMN